VQSKAGKVKSCKGKEFQVKFRNTPFSLGLGRKEENAEGCRHFMQKSGVCDQYLTDDACANFAKEK
jgi:hypothetical protein